MTSLLPPFLVVHSVLVLAPDDTHTNLVSSAAQICELVVQGRLQPDTICPALLSSTSQGRCLATRVCVCVLILVVC